MCQRKKLRSRLPEILLLNHCPLNRWRRRSSRRNQMKALRSPKLLHSRNQRPSLKSPPGPILAASLPCRNRLARSPPSGVAVSLTLVSAHLQTKRSSRPLKQPPVSAPNTGSIRRTTPTRSPRGVASVKTGCHHCPRLRRSLRGIRLEMLISPRLEEEAMSTSRTFHPSRR